jgi:hypothetical protein
MDVIELEFKLRVRMGGWAPTNGKGYPPGAQPWGMG